MSQDQSHKRSSLLATRTRLGLVLAIGLGLTLAAGLFALIGRAAPGNPVLHPARNTHTAPPTTTVSITYDEPISATTVTSHTFAVHAMQSGLMTATHDVVNGNTIIVTPTQTFHPGELVQTTATTYTTNITGEHPISPTVWQFRAAVLGGSGQFPISNTFGTGNDSTSVLALGDVDGDGDLDLVVGNDWEQNRLYLNDGDGTFDTISYTFGPGSDRTYALALGDVDGDGDLDLAAGNIQAELVHAGDYDPLPAMPGGQNVLYLNDGADNPFDTITHTFGTGDYTFGLALGDVDGDGDLDLAVANANLFEGEQNVLYLNDGDGNPFDTITHTFGSSSDYTLSLALGDVDGDGDLDLAAGNINEQNVVYLNDGVDNPFDTITHTFDTSTDYTARVALGDVDGDGDLDLAAGNINEQNVVYLNNGAGNPFDTITHTFGTGSDRTSGLALGDVDGDGDLDLAVGNYAELPVHLDNHDPLAMLSGQNVVYLNRDRADLSIVKTINRHAPAPGDPIIYTLTFTNNGPQTATGVVITDTIPVSVTNTGVVSSGVTITDTGASPGYVWEVQDLGVGQGGTLTITGRLSDTLPNGHVFTNTATITTTTAVDANTGNNSNSVGVTVRIYADLVITKTIVPGSTSPGDPITYTLTFTNNGPHTAAGVVITDIIPVSVTNTSVVSSGVAITDTGASPGYVWSVQDLGVGQGGTITITGRLSDTLPIGHVFTNTATITTTTAMDANAGNNSNSASTTVYAYVRLPLVFRNYLVAPDLVVQSVTATRNSVQVVVKNEGNGPVSDEFWVQVYIDPDPAPTGVNQLWYDLGDEGMLWGVTSAALPLAPGDTITLTYGDVYYWPSLSRFYKSLAAGTPVYAQVDAWNEATTYGAILESHEVTGDTYNNISGPFYRTAIP